MPRTLGWKGEGNVRFLTPSQSNPWKYLKRGNKWISQKIWNSSSQTKIARSCTLTFDAAPPECPNGPCRDVQLDWCDTAFWWTGRLCYWCSFGGSDRMPQCREVPSYRFWLVLTLGREACWNRIAIENRESNVKLFERRSEKARTLAKGRRSKRWGGGENGYQIGTLTRSKTSEKVQNGKEGGNNRGSFD